MKHIIYLVAAVCLHSCNPKKNTSSNKTMPNILFIMVDDLGKEWISHYGAEDINTPNIDALAESGMTFHKVYSMPQCTPTRLSILTGQYPFRHGWVNHWDVPRWGGGAHYDETVNPSLGLELKKAGYTTCIAGKWQIDDFRVEPDALTRNGFDEYCMWTGYETGIPASAERYQDPYLFTKEGSKTYADQFGPDVFKEFIVDFIQREKDKPLFIYYPMVLTHTPLINTPLEQASDKLGKQKAMVRYTDKITGELVYALEQAGIRDNTIIVWTTDNGSTRSISGTRNGSSIQGGKMRTTEAGICEPFLVSWPNEIDPNSESNALIDFTDLFPTFLDLAGITPQKNWKVGKSTQKIDGQSFKEVLLGNKDSEREWIMSMGGGNKAALTENGIENQYYYRDRVLRNQRYKLYIDSRRTAEKFFDLETDPLENNNLIDSLNTDVLKSNFQQLFQQVNNFPNKDNDPRYIANPAQEWDVPITAKSQQWKIGK